MKVKYCSRKCRFILFAMILSLVCAAFNFVITAPPSSPLFNLTFFKFVLYPDKHEPGVFKRYARENIPRKELEKIIFDAGGYVLESSASDERTKNVDWGYGLDKRGKFENIKVSSYVRYHVPGISVTNLGGSYPINAYYDEDDLLKVLLVNNEIVFPDK